jgi:hypothetical protein
VSELVGVPRNSFRSLTRAVLCVQHLARNRDRKEAERIQDGRRASGSFQPRRDRKTGQPIPLRRSTLRIFRAGHSFKAGSYKTLQGKGFRGRAYLALGRGGSLMLALVDG